MSEDVVWTDDYDDDTDLGDAKRYKVDVYRDYLNKDIVRKRTILDNGTEIIDLFSKGTDNKIGFIISFPPSKVSWYEEFKQKLKEKE